MAHQPKTPPALGTPSDLGANATRDIAGALNGVLADVFALYLKTKNFHWHMSGPHFRDYHLMLDEQSDQIFAMTDVLAERVRKIGQLTLHSIGEISRNQRISDNDAPYVTPQDMLAGRQAEIHAARDRKLEAARAHFAGANAHRPPFVLKGDTLSASTFWHGKLLDQWANQWVSYHTDGKGNFVTSAMEDTGVLQSLSFLHHAGRVDLDRVMVLRTVSNFDQPPTGLTAAESLAASSGRRYSAYLPALEAAYRVGNVVVSEIVTNWDRYQDRLPGSQLKEKP